MDLYLHSSTTSSWSGAYLSTGTILPLSLIHCKITSLTLREEPRLRLFENRMLRRIFGPKREKLASVWRKLHNKELHNFYASQNVIKVIKSGRMKWMRHVAGIGKIRYYTKF
jgi:hypothetical protein